MPLRSKLIWSSMACALVAATLVLALRTRGTAPDTRASVRVRHELTNAATVARSDFPAAEVLHEASAREEVSLPPIESAESDANAAHMIAGVVLDERGAPLAKAYVRIQFEDESIPHVNMENTDASGTFEFRPTAAGRFSLEVMRAGFHPHHDSRPLRVTGTKGIRIALRAVPTTSFVVRDRATGEPVTSFALRIGYPSSSPYRDWTIEQESLREWEGGVHAAQAAEGHHVVHCEAPGYAAYEATVQHDPPGSGQHVISLARPGRIKGSVDLARIREIEIDRQPLTARTPFGNASPDCDWSWSQGDRFDLSEMVGVTIPEVDASGKFSFRDLRPGTYRLLVSRAEQDFLMYEGVVVGAGETVDLGFIDAGATGALSGTVRLAAGLSTAGLQVALYRRHPFLSVVHGRPLSSAVVQTDEAGRFRCERLAPGSHRLSIAPRAPGFAGISDLLVTVQPGETSHVELDLSRATVGPICVSASIDGAPAPGIEILPVEGASHGPASKTDEAGRVCADFDVSLHTHLLARAPSQLPLGLLELGDGHASTRLEQVDFALRCGRVRLKLLNLPLLDTSEEMHLRWTRRDWPLPACEMAIRLDERIVGIHVDVPQSSVSLPALATGEWTLLATVRHRASEHQTHESLARAKLVVEEGRETRCDLRFQ